ncbi:MAG: sulfite exporter TauE/SafE family protein [Gammaproteobacteria bacterium]|nr:sulfite exporter TauE/SafE family protein [Gammaproteobacteria bacterium]
MMSEAQVLLVTAATIAFLHTILGPDHYLVFTAMGKARAWSLAKTLRITFYCGIGHVLGSLLLGALGLLAGAQLASLVEIEGLRGNLAGWALLTFGLVYFAWGLKKAGRSHRHSHAHVHDGVAHAHEHDHRHEHAHVHAERSSITPWVVFVIFVLGPCEALIPLFMYPAAQHNALLVAQVAIVFSVITLLTMLACVAITTIGLDRLRLPATGRYGHAAAGAAVLACGMLVSFTSL